MHLIISYSILIIFCSSIVKSQESCRTPQNETGTCIPLNDCKPLLDLMTQPAPLPNFVIDFLQKSFCGLHADIHYLCCSNWHITTTSTTTPLTKTITPTIASISDVDVNVNVGKMDDVSNHPNLNLLPEYCDIPIKKSHMIVGKGEYTSLEEFPFMALLQYGKRRRLEFACGGTIINERYILTAAHCVSDPVRKLFSVRVGEHDISTTIDCDQDNGNCASPVEDIQVEEIIFHPLYNRPRFANDIAVIRLQRDIQFRSNINAICLPINNETQYANLDRLTIAGWGFTEHGMRSDILLQADLLVVNQSRCQEQYGLIKVLESQICAGGVGASETCNGDSGGPLFSTALEKPVQYGVVAAGHRECGHDIIPGLYTRISHYMKWILDQLRP